MAAVIMLDGGGGPARERLDTFRMLRRCCSVALFLASDRVLAGNRLLVERVGIIEDVISANATFGEPIGQSVVIRPIVFAALSFDSAPGEVVANEFETGS